MTERHTPAFKNAIAAAFAGASVYDPASPFYANLGYIGLTRDVWDPKHKVAIAAAEFLRQWPEALTQALPIHLKRAGFDVPEAGPHELAAWKVFGFALRELDALTKAEDEAAAKAALVNNNAPQNGGLPLDRALQVQPGAFDPSGFSPRR